MQVIEGFGPATEFDRFARIFDEGLAQKLGTEVAPARPAGMPAALHDGRKAAEASEGLRVGKTLARSCQKRRADAAPRRDPPQSYNKSTTGVKRRTRILSPEYL